MPHPCRGFAARMGHLTLVEERRFSGAQAFNYDRNGGYGEIAAGPERGKVRLGLRDVGLGG